MHTFYAWVCLLHNNLLISCQDKVGSFRICNTYQLLTDRGIQAACGNITTQNTHFQTFLPWSVILVYKCGLFDTFLISATMSPKSNMSNQGCRSCSILPSRMGEHEVSLENIGNMENMENMEKMENINQMTQKSPEDFWRRKASFLLLMF